MVGGNEGDTPKHALGFLRKAGELSSTVHRGVMGTQLGTVQGEAAEPRVPTPESQGHLPGGDTCAAISCGLGRASSQRFPCWEVDPGVLGF